MLIIFNYFYLKPIIGHRGTGVGLKYIQNSDNSRMIDASLIGGATETTCRKESTTYGYSSISSVSSSSSNQPRHFDGLSCLSGATFNNSNISIFVGSRGPESTSSADIPTPTTPSVPLFLMSPVAVAAPPPPLLAPHAEGQMSTMRQQENAEFVGYGYDISSSPTIDSPTVESPPLTQASVPLPAPPLIVVSESPFPAAALLLDVSGAEEDSEEELSYTQHCVALRESCTFRSTRAPRNSVYSPPMPPPSRKRKLPVIRKRCHGKHQETSKKSKK